MRARISFRSGTTIDADVRDGVAAIATQGSVRLHPDGRVTPENDNLFTSGTWAPVPTTNKAFNAVDFVTAFENGELEQDEIVNGFQHMVDNDLVWQLQGHYGRVASDLIRRGLVKAPTLRRREN